MENSNGANFKVLKYFVIGIIVIAFLVVIYSLFSGKTPTVPETNTNNGQAATTSPQNIFLTAEQKASAAEFAKNFLVLYNNYAYEDYSNFLALGDYETQNAQQQTQDLIAQLKQKTPIGFTQTSKAVESSITVEMANMARGSLKVKADLEVIQSVISNDNGGVSARSSSGPPQKSINQQITLTLVPYGTSWLVDDILISQN